MHTFLGVRSSLASLESNLMSVGRSDAQNMMPSVKTVKTVKKRPSYLEAPSGMFDEAKMMEVYNYCIKCRELQWVKKHKEGNDLSKYPPDPSGFTSSSEAIYDVLLVAARKEIRMAVNRTDVKLWLHTLPGEPSNLNSTIQAYTKDKRGWQTDEQLLVRSKE